jgi:acetyl-CoA synthetase
LLACTDALLADPGYGALVTSHAYAYASATDRLPVFSQAAATHGKIVCNVWAPEWLDGPGAMETEVDPHLALFHSMDRCFAVLAAWHRRAELRQAPRPVHGRFSHPSAITGVMELLRGVTEAALTEHEAKRVLALYGVPVVSERRARDPDAAVAAAAALGFPVVLKGDSPDVQHKTEAGMVRLDLREADEVRRAYQAILDAAASMTPRPELHGVLVQPMVPKGIEVMVGARHDPQFGPLVVVGLGGVFVEALHDIALAPAPVGLDEALAMLQGLRGAALLRGFRGAEPVGLARLAEMVCRVSELAADAEGLIAEMEVNPFICAGDRILAVDALIVKAK